VIALLAVNVANSRVVEKPPEQVSRSLPGDRYEYFCSPKKVWDAEFRTLVGHFVQAGLVQDKVEHRIGGPVEPAEAFGLVDLPMLNNLEVENGYKQAASSGSKNSSLSTSASSKAILQLASADPLSFQQAQKLRIKSSLFFGDLSVILTLLANLYANNRLEADAEGTIMGKKKKPPLKLKVFWGYASWNATQLLGEIARRSWGLVVSDSARLGFANWDSCLGEWDLLVDQSVVAKETEYAAF